jgi:hypothetical protein
MKKLEAKRMSASKAGDYFQVLFEEDRDSLKNYFLIQRGFDLISVNDQIPAILRVTTRRFVGT